MSERVHCPCHFACEKDLGFLLVALEALAGQYRTMLAIGGYQGNGPRELLDAEAAASSVRSRHPLTE